MRGRTARIGVGIGAALALAVATGGIAAAPALAATAPTSPVFAFDSGFSPAQTPAYPWQESVFADGSAVTVDAATTTLVQMTVPGSDAIGNTIQIGIAPGGTLHTGTFTVTGDVNDPTHPYVSVGNGYFPFPGRLDVLDMATSPTGVVTRFDAVFLSYPDNAGAAQYGELRFGEPEPAVVVGQPHLAFPRTAIGGTRVLAVERLHNTSTTAAKVGTIAVSGGAAADYRIGGDTCSGRTLAAGASCTFLAGFSATRPGPRNSGIVVPIGSTTQTITTTGAGAVGQNQITTTWPFDVDHPVTQTEVNGGTYELAVEPTSRVGWDWYASRTYTPVGSDLPDQVEFGPATGKSTIPLGTSPVQGLYDVGSPYSDLGYPGASFSRPGLDCQPYSGVRFGTQTVHAFTLGADRLPSQASIDFTGNCSGESQPVTVQLRWQVRSDVTAPAAVRSLSVTSGAVRTVRWVQSSSADVSVDVVRVVPGNGSGATPSSGLPVKFGLTTTGTLPTLVHGAAYTVVAFAVDGTGNVSTAATAHITG